MGAAALQATAHGRITVVRDPATAAPARATEVAEVILVVAAATRSAAEAGIRVVVAVVGTRVAEVDTPAAGAVIPAADIAKAERSHDNKLM